MKFKLRAFTLTELLVVISIISVLAVLGANSFSYAMKKARDTKRMENLKQYKLALETYRVDHPTIGYPSYANFREIYPNYFSAPAPAGNQRFTLQDPLFRLSVPPDTMAVGSYYYNFALINNHFFLAARLELPNNDSSTNCNNLLWPYGTYMDCRNGVTCPPSDPQCLRCNYCLTNN